MENPDYIWKGTLLHKQRILAEVKALATGPEDMTLPDNLHVQQKIKFAKFAIQVLPKAVQDKVTTLSCKMKLFSDGGIGFQPCVLHCEDSTGKWLRFADFLLKDLSVGVASIEGRSLEETSVCLFLIPTVLLQPYLDAETIGSANKLLGLFSWRAEDPDTRNIQGAPGKPDTNVTSLPSATGVSKTCASIGTKLKVGPTENTGLDSAHVLLQPDSTDKKNVANVSSISATSSKIERVSEGDDQHLRSHSPKPDELCTNNRKGDTDKQNSNIVIQSDPLLLKKAVVLLKRLKIDISSCNSSKTLSKQLKPIHEKEKGHMERKQKIPNENRPKKKHRTSVISKQVKNLKKSKATSKVKAKKDGHTPDSHVKEDSVYSKGDVQDKHESFDASLVTNKEHEKENKTVTDLGTGDLVAEQTERSDIFRTRIEINEEMDSPDESESSNSLEYSQKGQQQNTKEPPTEINAPAVNMVTNVVADGQFEISNSLKPAADLLDTAESKEDLQDDNRSLNHANNELEGQIKSVPNFLGTLKTKKNKTAHVFTCKKMIDETDSPDESDSSKDSEMVGSGKCEDEHSTEDSLVTNKLRQEPVKEDNLTEGYKRENIASCDKDINKANPYSERQESSLSEALDKSHITSFSEEKPSTKVIISTQRTASSDQYSDTTESVNSITEDPVCEESLETMKPLFDASATLEIKNKMVEKSSTFEIHAETPNEFKAKEGDAEENESEHSKASQYTLVKDDSYEREEKRNKEIIRNRPFQEPLEEIISGQDQDTINTQIPKESIQVADDNKSSDKRGDCNDIETKHADEFGHGEKSENESVSFKEETHNKGIVAHSSISDLTASKFDTQNKCSTDQDFRDSSHISYIADDSPGDVGYAEKIDSKQAKMCLVLENAQNGKVISNKEPLAEESSPNKATIRAARHALDTRNKQDISNEKSAKASASLKKDDIIQSSQTNKNSTILKETISSELETHSFDQILRDSESTKSIPGVLNTKVRPEQNDTANNSQGQIGTLQGIDSRQGKGLSPVRATAPCREEICNKQVLGEVKCKDMVAKANKHQECVIDDKDKEMICNNNSAKRSVLLKKVISSGQINKKTSILKTPDESSFSADQDMKASESIRCTSHITNQEICTRINKLQEAFQGEARDYGQCDAKQTKETVKQNVQVVFESPCQEPPLEKDSSPNQTVAAVAQGETVQKASGASSSVNMTRQKKDKVTGRLQAYSYKLIHGDKSDKTTGSLMKDKVVESSFNDRTPVILGNSLQNEEGKCWSESISLTSSKDRRELMGMKEDQLVLSRPKHSEIETTEMEASPPSKCVSHKMVKGRVIKVSRHHIDSKIQSSAIATTEEYNSRQWKTLSSSSKFNQTEIQELVNVRNGSSANIEGAISGYDVPLQTMSGKQSEVNRKTSVCSSERQTKGHSNTPERMTQKPMSKRKVTLLEHVPSYTKRLCSGNFQTETDISHQKSLKPRTVTGKSAPKRALPMEQLVSAKTLCFDEGRHSFQNADGSVENQAFQYASCEGSNPLVTSEKSEVTLERGESDHKIQINQSVWAPSRNAIPSPDVNCHAPPNRRSILPVKHLQGSVSRDPRYKGQSQVEKKVNKSRKDSIYNPVHILHIDRAADPETYSFEDPYDFPIGMEENLASLENQISSKATKYQDPRIPEKKRIPYKEYVTDKMPRRPSFKTTAQQTVEVAKFSKGVMARFSRAKKNVFVQTDETMTGKELQQMAMKQSVLGALSALITSVRTSMTSSTQMTAILTIEKVMDIISRTATFDLQNQDDNSTTTQTPIGTTPKKTKAVPVKGIEGEISRRSTKKTKHEENVQTLKIDPSPDSTTEKLTEKARIGHKINSRVYNDRPSTSTQDKSSGLAQHEAKVQIPEVKSPGPKVGAFTPEQNPHVTRNDELPTFVHNKGQEESKISAPIPARETERWISTGHMMGPPSQIDSPSNQVDVNDGYNNHTDASASIPFSRVQLNQSAEDQMETRSSNDLKEIILSNIDLSSETWSKVQKAVTDNPSLSEERTNQSKREFLEDPLRYNDEQISSVHGGSQTVRETGRDTNHEPNVSALFPNLHIFKSNPNNTPLDSELQDIPHDFKQNRSYGTTDHQFPSQSCMDKDTMNMRGMAIQSPVDLRNGSESHLSNEYRQNPHLSHSRTPSQIPSSGYSSHSDIKESYNNDGACISDDRTEWYQSSYPEYIGDFNMNASGNDPNTYAEFPSSQPEKPLPINEINLEQNIERIVKEYLEGHSIGATQNPVPQDDRSEVYLEAHDQDTSECTDCTSGWKGNILELLYAKLFKDNQWNRYPNRKKNAQMKSKIRAGILRNLNRQRSQYSRRGNYAYQDKRDDRMMKNCHYLDGAGEKDYTNRNNPDDHKNFPVTLRRGATAHFVNGRYSGYSVLDAKDKAVFPRIRGTQSRQANNSAGIEGPHSRGNSSPYERPEGNNAQRPKFKYRNKRNIKGYCGRRDAWDGNKDRIMEERPDYYHTPASDQSGGEAKDVSPYDDVESSSAEVKQINTESWDRNIHSTQTEHSASKDNSSPDDKPIMKLHKETEVSPSTNGSKSSTAPFEAKVYNSGTNFKEQKSFDFNNYESGWKGSEVDKGQSEKSLQKKDLVLLENNNTGNFGKPVVPEHSKVKTIYTGEGNHENEAIDVINQCLHGVGGNDKRSVTIQRPSQVESHSVTTEDKEHQSWPQNVASETNSQRDDFVLDGCEYISSDDDETNADVTSERKKHHHDNIAKSGSPYSLSDTASITGPHEVSDSRTRSRKLVADSPWRKRQVQNESRWNFIEQMNVYKSDDESSLSDKDEYHKTREGDVQITRKNINSDRTENKFIKTTKAEGSTPPDTTDQITSTKPKADYYSEGYMDEHKAKTFYDDKVATIPDYAKRRERLQPFLSKIITFCQDWRRWDDFNERRQVVDEWYSMMVYIRQVFMCVFNKCRRSRSPVSWDGEKMSLEKAYSRVIDIKMACAILKYLSVFCLYNLILAEYKRVANAADQTTFPVVGMRQELWMLKSCISSCYYSFESLVNASQYWQQLINWQLKKYIDEMYQNCKVHSGHVYDLEGAVIRKYIHDKPRTENKDKIPMTTYLSGKEIQDTDNIAWSIQYDKRKVHIKGVKYGDSGDDQHSRKGKRLESLHKTPREDPVRPEEPLLDDMAEVRQTSRKTVKSTVYRPPAPVKLDSTSPWVIEVSDTEDEDDKDKKEESSVSSVKMQSKRRPRYSSSQTRPETGQRDDIQKLDLARHTSGETEMTDKHLFQKGNTTPEKITNFIKSIRESDCGLKDKQICEEDSFPEKNPEKGRDAYRKCTANKHDEMPQEPGKGSNKADTISDFALGKFNDRGNSDPGVSGKPPFIGKRLKIKFNIDARKRNIATGSAKSHGIGGVFEGLEENDQEVPAEIV